MSSRDNQKVWWIKREKNYFDKHNIKVLLKEKNGPIFFILYEKMCCESIPWKGELKYSSDQVYDEKKLSAITEIPLKLVTSGLAKLQELEFIEIKDDSIYVFVKSTTKTKTEIVNIMGLVDTIIPSKYVYVKFV